MAIFKRNNKGFERKISKGESRLNIEGKSGEIKLLVQCVSLCFDAFYVNLSRLVLVKITNMYQKLNVQGTLCTLPGLSY